MASSIRTTLIRRITLIFIITFIAVLSSIALMTIYTANTHLKNSEKQLFQALLTKGNTLVSNNSQALIDMVSDNSFSAITNLVSATVKNDSDIVYGIFMDAEQRPWIISNSSSENKHLAYDKVFQDKLSLWAAKLQQSDYIKVTQLPPPGYTAIKDSNTVYEFAAPVFSRSEQDTSSELLGTIRYGISMAQMEAARIEAQSFSRQVMIITLLILFLLGCIAIFFAFLATRHTATLLTQPLAELSQATIEITRGNYDALITISDKPDNDNEIGILSRSFNAMQFKIKETLEQLLLHQNELKDLNQHLEEKVNERTAELKAVQKELLEAARAAGMAEVAINVLHNIGNVINSVNIANQDNFEQLKCSKLPALLKTNELLQNNSDHIGAYLQSDPRGSKIPELLDKLGLALEKEHTLLLDNATRMMQSIAIVGNIIATQQKYAHNNLYNEELNLQTVLEDSLDILAASFSNHAIQVISNYQATPPVLADNAKLHQVLNNILVNARQALLGNEIEQRIIQVSIIPEQDYALISIRDNGSGIISDSLTEIFQHGFTTKKDGHGFGLHSCANLLGEMGGNISVDSNGKGMGACFNIRLPLVKNKT